MSCTASWATWPRKRERRYSNFRGSGDGDESPGDGLNKGREDDGADESESEEEGQERNDEATASADRRWAHKGVDVDVVEGVMGADSIW